MEKTKIKPQHIFIGVGGFMIFLVIFVFIITKLVLDLSLWWTGGLLIIEAVIGLISGVSYLIYKLQRIESPVTRQDPTEIKQVIITEIQQDLENPDNFKIEKQRIINTGEPNKPKTQLVWFKGYGTELNNRIDVVVNLMNPKLEYSRLDGATDEEIKETIRQMAENPETEVVSKTTIAQDIFGRPVQTTETKGVTLAEKELNKEKEEAELKGTF